LRRGAQGLNPEKIEVVVEESAEGLLPNWPFGELSSTNGITVPNISLSAASDKPNHTTSTNQVISQAADCFWRTT
jgi:hypothetical protein